MNQSRAYKYPQDSFTETNEIVLPNDTNTLNNLMGGRLLHLMDVTAAIAAQKHSGNICVTAAVNNVSFDRAVKLGSALTLQAKVIRAYRTSMEVQIVVYEQEITLGKPKSKCNEAYYTFVAIDEHGEKVVVPEVRPLSDEEKRLYDSALIRRQLNLLLNGKKAVKEMESLKKQMAGWLEQ